MVNSQVLFSVLRWFPGTHGLLHLLSLLSTCLLPQTSLQAAESHGLGLGKHLEFAAMWCATCTLPHTYLLTHVSPLLDREGLKSKYCIEAIFVLPQHHTLEVTP